MKRDQGDTVEGKWDKPWLPVGIIIVASALAHLWCLGSQFYMDDMPQIRDSEVIRSGHFWEMRLSGWTYLSYVVQYRLFGMSAVGFHAVNWLLHTAVACVLFGFARESLREKSRFGVALFAGLWFAVHPLASEIPNYVRTQDLAWVTLFSLLAAWAMLRFLRDGGWELDDRLSTHRQRWGWLAVCALAVMGATFSKGPGMFHALLATWVVGLVFMPPGLGNLLRRKKWLLPVVVAGMVAAMWLLGLLKFGLAVHDQWLTPRFIGHGYTVARVFWEFAWRSVIPVALCSDHHIAETLVPGGAKFWNIPDKVAMLAATGMLGLTFFSGFLAWRKATRLFGVCLFLFVATLLIRVLYLIPEFMPEYRIYPGLPWFCLGAAIALTAAWRWMFTTVSPRVPVVVLLGVLIALSAERSLLWRDLDRLMANVLKQYPAQARAIWELDDRDLAAENWQAVIARQEQVWPEVRRKFIASLSELGPARELPSGHFSLAEVACTGRYAVAIAHAKNPAEGLRVIDGLEKYMQSLRIDPVTNPNHWNLFKRDKALVLETGGSYQAALDCLKRNNGQPQTFPQDFARISKKLAARQPSL